MADSAAISGAKFKFSVSFDGGVNYTIVSEQQDVSLNINPITDDATNKTTSPDGNDTVWREPVVVGMEWDGQVNCDRLDDSTQQQMRAAAIAGTRLWFRMMPEVGSGKEVYTGKAILRLQQSGAVLNLQRNVYDLTGSGPLSRGTQA